MIDDLNDDLGFVILVTLIWLIVSLGVYAWYAFALSKVFPKIDAEPWKAWVPIVNEAQIFTKGGVPGWSVIFYAIPGLNLYALYLRVIATGRINASLGRGTALTVLAVFLPPVWATLLATGSNASTTAPAHAPTHAPAPAPAQPEASSRLPVITPADAARLASRTPADGTVESPQQEQSQSPAPAQSRPPAPPQPPAPADPQVSQPEPEHAPSHDVAPAHDSAQTPAPASAAPVSPYLASQDAGQAAQATSEAQPSPVPPPPPASEEPAPPAAPKPVVVHNPWAARPEAEPAPTSAATPVISAPPEAAPTVPTPSPPPSDPVVTTPAQPNADAPVEDDDDDDYGETVVVDRRPKIRWTLTVDGVGPFPLPSEHVLLGRKPTTTAANTHALSIPDSTRTLSKVHARLDLSDGEWTITDLNSTNGVVVLGDDGSETVLDPGSSVPAPDRFMLGKVGMSISFEDAGA